MRKLLVVYCAGILSGTYLPAELLWLGKFSLFASLFLFAGFFWIPLQQQWKNSLWPILLCVAGISWHAIWAERQLLQRLPLDLEGTDFFVEGVVNDLPRRTALTQQFEFIIQKSENEFQGRKVRLDYYGERDIEVGQLWQFQVRLKQPRGLANPGGFDFEAWAMQQGLSATGYVRPETEQLLVNAVSFRGRLYSQLNKLLVNSEFRGLILALTLGFKSDIAGDLQETFSNTGTNHLWVISGLHIGLITALVFLLSKFVFRFYPGLFSIAPLLLFSAVSSLFAACFYAYLAGFSLSTQRALIMALAFLAGSLWRRSMNWSLRFCFALTLVLSLNPLASQNAGFWFSFIAVAILLLFAQESNTNPSHTLYLVIKKTIDSQWKVWLGLSIPLSFWLGQFSYSAPLINLVAIPVVGFLIVPFCLLLAGASFISTRISELLISCLEILFSSLFAFLEWVSNSLPMSGAVNLTANNMIIYLFAIVGCLVLLLPIRQKFKLLALPLLLPIGLPATDKLENGEWNLTVFDVGQGLAVLIETRDHALLYDTGAGLDTYTSVANASVLPALRKNNIGKLDALVISHGDNDHSGGATTVLDQVKVTQVFASSSVALPNVSVALCDKNWLWEWDDVTFQFLNEVDGFQDSNNNSCVMKIGSTGNSILLPGDIEKAAEHSLSASYRENLASSILLAPHHGSNTSSTHAFVKHVKPETVIYSAGYRNQFGHPAVQVQHTYRSYGAMGLKTADLGMIQFRSRNNFAGIEIDSFRQSRPRYWRHQAIGELADITNYSGKARIW